jgi:hypothetical protein
MVEAKNEWSELQVQDHRQSVTYIQCSCLAERMHSYRKSPERQEADFVNVTRTLRVQVFGSADHVEHL